MLGLPVLVADRGAPPSRVGSRGLVFPAGDARALREILEGFLAEPSRLDDLRRGAHGLHVAMDAHRRELAALYARAVAPRGAG